MYTGVFMKLLNLWLIAAHFLNLTCVSLFSSSVRSEEAFAKLCVITANTFIKIIIAENAFCCYNCFHSSHWTWNYSRIHTHTHPLHLHAALCLSCFVCYFSFCSSCFLLATSQRQQTESSWGCWCSWLCWRWLPSSPPHSPTPPPPAALPPLTKHQQQQQRHYQHRHLARIAGVCLRCRVCWLLGCQC